jgi:hypothetical protein
MVACRRIVRIGGCVIPIVGDMVDQQRRTYHRMRHRQHR